MPRRRWTVMLLPPRNERSRSFEVPEWAVKSAAWLGGFALVLVLAAVTVLFTPWGTPGARYVAAENDALRTEIATIEQRFAELEDTLRAIAQRESQMRTLAGLPVDSEPRPAVLGSAAGARDTNGPRTQGGGLGAATMSLTGATDLVAEVKRPFLGRLGWGTRPDIEGLIAQASVLSAGFRDASDTLEANYKRFERTPSIMPTSGWLTSQFTRSRFHPILHTSRAHEGIDVTAPTGTPIVSPAAGRVVFAGQNSGYGLVVEIDHGNGIHTRFAHCSRLSVRAGQQVTRGQLIAAVGTTGLSTGPHLHYEIHVNGKPVDPLRYVLPEPAN